MASWAIHSERFLSLARLVRGLLALIAILAISPRSTFAQAQPTTDPSNTTFQTLRTSGDEKFQNSDFSDAAALYAAAEVLRPQDVGIHYRLSRTSLKLGEKDQGLREIAEMARLKPKLKDDAQLSALAAALEALPSKSPQSQGNASVQPATPSITSDATALTVKTVELIIDQMKLPENQQQPNMEKRLAQEARSRLAPALLDPEQSNVKVWWCLGVTAVALQNKSDAQFAFEAIPRLRPDYQNDDRLFTLVAQLNRMGMDAAKSSLIDQGRQLVVRSRETVRESQELLRVPANGTIAHTILCSQFYLLGSYYLNGEGVPINSDEASIYFHLAADEGNGDAMYALGVLAQNGNDKNSVIDWWTKAVAAGSTDAQNALANIGINVKNPQQIQNEEAQQLAQQEQQRQAQLAEQTREREAEEARLRQSGALDRLRDELQNIDPPATQPSTPPPETEQEKLKRLMDVAGIDSPASDTTQP
jgi:hypothetical protein